MENLPPLIGCVIDTLEPSGRVVGSVGFLGLNAVSPAMNEQHVQQMVADLEALGWGPDQLVIRHILCGFAEGDPLSIQAAEHFSKSPPEIQHVLLFWPS